MHAWNGLPERFAGSKHCATYHLHSQAVAVYDAIVVFAGHVGYVLVPIR